MDLRKLLKCPVTVALLILWAALSVVGYLGKDTIYKNYTVIYERHHTSSWCLTDCMTEFFRGVMWVRRAA